jgi:hypothetical protein
VVVSSIAVEALGNQILSGMPVPCNLKISGWRYLAQNLSLDETKELLRAVKTMEEKPPRRVTLSL